MQVRDLKDGQLIAIIRPYQGLHKGLKGIVLGYSRKQEKVLVKLFNKGRTEEYVPLSHIIGVLLDV